MRIFKLVLAALSATTAWYLAKSLTLQELHIVVAAGVMLAATALGVTVSAGTTLMLLLRRLKGTDLSPRRLASLQSELWMTTFLFFPGLVMAIICVVATPPLLAVLVVVDSAILGLAYAHLVSSARLFYQFAQGR